MDELYPMNTSPLVYPQTPYILTILALLMVCLSVICIKEFRTWLFFSWVFFVMSAVTQIVLFRQES